MTEDQLFYAALGLAYLSVMTLLIVLNFRLKRWNNTPDAKRPAPPLHNVPDVPPILLRRRYTDT